MFGIRILFIGIIAILVSSTHGYAAVEKESRVGITAQRFQLYAKTVHQKTRQEKILEKRKRLEEAISQKRRMNQIPVSTNSFSIDGKENSIKKSIATDSAKTSFPMRVMREPSEKDISQKILSYAIINTIIIIFGVRALISFLTYSRVLRYH